VPYSTNWCENFDDEFFLNCIRQWIREGRIDPRSQPRPLAGREQSPAAEEALGTRAGGAIARELSDPRVFARAARGLQRHRSKTSAETLASIRCASAVGAGAAMRKLRDEEEQAVSDWLFRRRDVSHGSDPATTRKPTTSIWNNASFHRAWLGGSLRLRGFGNQNQQG